MIFVSLLILAQTPNFANDLWREKVLWDGGRKAVGVGWVSPGKANLTLADVSEIHPTSSRYVRFRGVASDTYLEAGWQWAPWSPAFVGTDFTGAENLTIRIRVDGPNIPEDLTLQLASPGDHHTSERLSLKKYAPKLADGKWHPIRIRIQDFLRTPSKFDPKHTIQVIFGVWSGKNCDFTLDFTNLSLTYKG